MLWSDLADGAFIDAAGWICDAVLAVKIPPGLDGSPGEAESLALLVGESHCADRLITGQVGLALCIFERAEHPHSQIIAYSFHVAGEAGTSGMRGRPDILCVCKKNC